MAGANTRRSSLRTPKTVVRVNTKTLRKSLPSSQKLSKAYECPQSGCTWSFPDSWKLQRHLQSHKKSKGKNAMKSASASPRSNVSSDLSVAQENPKFIDTGSKAFSCSECDYDTAVRSCMESHVLIVH